MTNWEKELKQGKDYKLMWNKLMDRVNDRTKKKMNDYDKLFSLKYGITNDDRYKYLWEHVKNIHQFIADNYDPVFMSYVYAIDTEEEREERLYRELNNLAKVESKCNACLIKFSIAFADYISGYKEQFNDATVPPHEVWRKIRENLIEREDSGTVNIMDRIESETNNKEIPENENRKFKGHLMKLLNVLPKLKWDACNYDNNNCNFMDIWFFIREAEGIQKYKMLLDCIEGRYEAYSNVSYYKKGDVESTPVCVKSSVIEDFRLILNMIDLGHTGVAKRRIQTYLYAFAYAKSLYKVFQTIGLEKDNVESLVYDLASELYKFYIDLQLDSQVMKLTMNGMYDLRVKMELRKDVSVSLAVFGDILISMRFDLSSITKKERILPFTEFENTLSEWVGDQNSKAFTEDVMKRTDIKNHYKSFCYDDTDEVIDNHIGVVVHPEKEKGRTVMLINKMYKKLYMTDIIQFKKSVMYIFKDESEDKDKNMIIGKYTGFPIIPKPEKDPIALKKDPLSKEKEDAWRKINLYWECVVARITYLVQYGEMSAADATNLIIHLGKFKVTNVYEELTIDDKWKKDKSLRLDEKTKDIIYQYIMLCTDIVLKDKLRK